MPDIFTDSGAELHVMELETLIQNLPGEDIQHLWPYLPALTEIIDPNMKLSSESCLVAINNIQSLVCQHLLENPTTPKPDQNGITEVAGTQRFFYLIDLCVTYHQNESTLQTLKNWQRKLIEDGVVVEQVPRS